MLLLYYWFYQHMPWDPIKVSSLINSLKTFSFLLLAWIMLIINNQSCRYCDKMVRLPNTKKICNMESIWWTTKSGKWLITKLDHKVHICWCLLDPFLWKRWHKPSVSALHHHYVLDVTALIHDMQYKQKRIHLDWEVDQNLIWALFGHT